MIRCSMIRISTLLSIVAPSVFSQVPRPAHVVIVVEENHDYQQIIGSSAAPYINSLAADTDAALFTQSFALTHPSQPNYLMLFSGSDQGVKNDSLPTGLPFKTDNLGASLIKAGKTFAGYCEDLPQAGFDGDKSGAYARKHNPWANWQNGSENGIPASANLPFSDFPKHYDSLPAVAFVNPNLNNDMHNGTDPGTITAADTWLRDHIDGYVQWAKKNMSLFILTFDEGKNSGNNRIVTLFAGAMVKHGQYSERIDHYSVLRTLEDMFGLSRAGSSATASSITGCWKGKTEILKTADTPRPLHALPPPDYVKAWDLDKLNHFHGSGNRGPVVIDLRGREETVPPYRVPRLQIRLTPGIPIP